VYESFLFVLKTVNVGTTHVFGAVPDTFQVMEIYAKIFA
jgi:hypothetical protein